MNTPITDAALEPSICDTKASVFERVESTCRQLERDRARLLDVVKEFQRSGARHDICPCRPLPGTSPEALELDAFWLRYAESMHATVKLNAATVLASLEIKE